MTTPLRPSPRELVQVGVLLAVGLVLLVGRFDWQTQPVAAQRGYVLSAFMFFIVLTGGWSFAWVLGWTEKKLCRIILAATTVLLNFPRHWVLLDRVDYYARFGTAHEMQRRFVPEWIGSGASWGANDIFFSVLLAAGAVAFAFARRRPGAVRAGVFFAAFTVVVLQTWLHSSNRSPYSYGEHFTQPLSNNHAYTTALLSGGRGLVNQDEGFFLHLEGLFLGTRAEPYTLVIRRAFVFYLSGNVSSVVGPYFGFILINVALWLAATAAFWKLVAELTDSLTARYAAIWLLISPGFIMYVAQPMTYLPGYAAIALLLYAVHRICGASRARSWPAIWTLGCIVSAGLLTTDLFVWLPSIVLFAWITGRSWGRVAMACGFAAAAYATWLWLVFGVLRLPHDPANDGEIFKAVRGTVALLRNPTSPEFWLGLAGAGGEFVKQLGLVFFIVPPLLSAGVLLLGNVPPVARRVAAVCIAPAAGTMVIFCLGESWLAKLSRFNFVAYPAVYLLAGCALAGIERAATQQGRETLGRVCVGSILVGFGILVNCDAFGAMPHMYYYFYYSFGGNFR